MQAMSGKMLDLRSTSLAKVSRYRRSTQSLGIIVFGEILFARDLHLFCFYGQVRAEETTRDFPTL
jgi:hypothetical protein